VGFVEDDACNFALCEVHCGSMCVSCMHGTTLQQLQR
jgi:hypothetical protein